MQKIAILTFEKNPISIDLNLKLRKKYRVFMLYTSRKGWLGLNSFSKYLKKKRGMRWLVYDLIFLYAKKIYGVDHAPERGWDELLNSSSEDFYEVDDCNSLQTENLLRKLAPDIGVLIGTDVIRPGIFNIPKYGMINLHQADLTRIRGAPPAFWEHKISFDEMCVTVHKVVERLDAGKVLEKKCFNIKEDPHFVISKFRANNISVNLLYSGIEKVLNHVDGKIPEKLGELKTVPGFNLLFWELLYLLKVNLTHKNNEKYKRYIQS